jgi:phosphopantetheinyl transferase
MTLMAKESPLGKGGQTSNRAAVPIQVVHDPLGRPHLRLGENRGPAISCSVGGGKIWAALCGDESDIGIDVAEPDEFQGEYPRHRVFHERELHHALRLAGGDLTRASALLWSVKEAVVKALGCAFHLVDPRQINVYPAVSREGGYTFPVSLSGKARVRFPLNPGRLIWVRSMPLAQMWLSIALLDWQDR